jgi:hypothetical protein
VAFPVAGGLVQRVIGVVEHACGCPTPPLPQCSGPDATGVTTMNRRYLAFDIETAKLIPENEPDWKSHRPLGISCAATLLADSDELVLALVTASNCHPENDRLQYATRRAIKGVRAEGVLRCR